MIDGTTQQTYERFREGVTLETALQVLENVLQKRRRTGKQKPMPLPTATLRNRYDEAQSGTKTMTCSDPEISVIIKVSCDSASVAISIESLRGQTVSRAIELILLSTMVLGGQTRNGLEGIPYALSTQLLGDFLLEHYNPAVTRGGFFSTNNMVVPRAHFNDLGGFDSSLTYGEDREFCYRWALHTYRFKWVRNAEILHFHDLNFMTFLQLHAKYGSGSFMFHRIAVCKLQAPLTKSPVTFYLKLIFHSLSGRFSLRGLGLTALLFCTQAANLCGMVMQWCIVNYTSFGKK